MYGIGDRSVVESRRVGPDPAEKSERGARDREPNPPVRAGPVSRSSHIVEISRARSPGRRAASPSSRRLSLRLASSLFRRMFVVHHVRSRCPASRIATRPTTPAAMTTLVQSARPAPLRIAPAQPLNPVRQWKCHRSHQIAGSWVETQMDNAGPAGHGEVTQRCSAR